MRIPLIISQGLIYILATIRAPRYRIYGGIKFYIDTGSPKSFIGQTDGIKSSVPYKKLNFKEPILMGAEKISLAEIQDVKLHFNVEGTTKVMELKIFRVAQNMRKQVIGALKPSILGTDFLLENNIKLVVDMSNNMAYLETQE
jgi:hypothetical protein